MPQGPTTGTDGKGVISCSHQDRQTGERGLVLATSSLNFLQAAPPAFLRTELLLPLRPGPESEALVPGLTFLIGASWAWGRASQRGQPGSREAAPKLRTLPSGELPSSNSPVEVALSFSCLLSAARLIRGSCAVSPRGGYCPPLPSPLWRCTAR